MKERDPSEALSTMWRIAPKYAQAKANRVYIEESLRSIKALEASRSPASSVAQKEMDAYASEPYRTAVAGLKTAVEEEETMRWQLITAQAAIEVWRTLEASNRSIDRSAR